MSLAPAWLHSGSDDITRSAPRAVPWVRAAGLELPVRTSPRPLAFFTHFPSPPPAGRPSVCSLCLKVCFCFPYFAF